jgi:nucleotide-binding universal stress UspA family protein
MAPVDVENLADARKQMTALRESVDKSVPLESIIRVGVATSGIVEAAKHLDIDLVILATHGRSGLAHVLLGSTAERVVRHAPCPVLVLREREREFVTCPSLEPRFGDKHALPG